MCVVSMIGDHYGDKWRPIINPPVVVPAPAAPTWPQHPHVVTREEFEALKRDVEEMKTLLVKAKAYDDAHNEPDCEMADKLAVLRKMAELVGVSLDDVFPNAHS